MNDNNQLLTIYSFFMPINYTLLLKLSNKLSHVEFISHTYCIVFILIFIGIWSVVDIKVQIENKIMNNILTLNKLIF